MKFNCKWCDQHLEAADEDAGLEIPCPTCRKNLKVPSCEHSIPKTLATGNIIVAVVFALINIGYMVWVGTLPLSDAELSIARILIGINCSLYIAATIALVNGRIKGGSIFMIIGGILNLPLGLAPILIAIRAYRRAHAADLLRFAPEIQTAIDARIQEIDDGVRTQSLSKEDLWTAINSLPTKQASELRRKYDMDRF